MDTDHSFADLSSLRFWPMVHRTNWSLRKWSFLPLHSSFHPYFSLSYILVVFTNFTTYLRSLSCPDKSPAKRKWGVESFHCSVPYSLFHSPNIVSSRVLDVGWCDGGISNSGEYYRLIIKQSPFIWLWRTWWEALFSSWPFSISWAFLHLQRRM